MGVYGARPRDTFHGTIASPMRSSLLSLLLEHSFKEEETATWMLIILSRSEMRKVGVVKIEMSSYTMRSVNVNIST